MAIVGDSRKGRMAQMPRPVGRGESRPLCQPATSGDMVEQMSATTANGRLMTFLGSGQSLASFLPTRPPGTPPAQAATPNAEGALIWRPLP